MFCKKQIKIIVMVVSETCETKNRLKFTILTHLLVQELFVLALSKILFDESFL